MHVVRQTDRRSLACSALAGLETGVLGGLALLAWLALGSLFAGHPAWWGLADLGTAAFGRGLSRGGFALAGVVGAALQIFGAGLVGILFGLAMRTGWALRRVVLLGILFGLGWYYLGYVTLLRRFGLGAHAFTHRRWLLVAHLLFGLILATYPRFVASLEANSQAGGSGTTLLPPEGSR